MVSLLKTVKNTDRLRQILTVLAKHGFGELLGRASLRSLIPGMGEAKPPAKTFAVRLREALQELGPSFIKLGQIVSTRPDIIPEEIVVELKKLQDDVPPMTADEMRAVIAETFGGTEQELFEHIDDAPLASASIGQVHVARLRLEHDDADPVIRDVVIKVQRPNIRKTIERDLDLLYLLARLIERHIPESRIYAPVQMVGEFDRAITAELDFGVEADNADRFSRNFQGDHRVRFPYVYRHASGKRVLTMERFRGDKIGAFCEAPGTGEVVAKNALHVIARMIFEHGFFHADPHPGNIIMLGSADDPVIGMIDLGLVGRLSPEMRDKAIHLMIAAVGSDTDALADALLGMGRPRGRVDMRAFRAEVATLADKYLGRPLAEVEMSALIRDLVQGAIKYEIEMPVEMVMVGKALMTVEGIGKEIHPELDVWSELKPYFMKLLWERYSPERLGRDLLSNITRLRTSAGQLPGQLTDILDDVRGGRLQVRTIDSDRDRLGRRFFSGTLTASLVIAASALLASGRHETLAWIFLSLAGVISLLHMWGDRRHRDTRHI